MTFSRAALLLTLCSGILGARAINICPSGSLSTLNVVLSTAGEDHTATRCALGDDAFLTFNATQLPSGGDRISASFSDGSVGTGGGIQFVGPSMEEAASLAPFTITIRNNNFLADAAIRLFGSLPPNSQVVVANNTLSVSRPVFSDISEILFASPLYMYEFMNPFRLHENSGFNITGNTVRCYSPNGDFACYGIGLWATLHLATNAWLEVTRNIVEAVGTEQWWSNGIDGLKDIYVEGEGTSVRIDFNNVSLQKGSGIEPPLVYTDRNHNNGLGDFSTFVSISHNRFVGNPDPLYPEAVYLERFIITGTSNYNVSDNYIEVYGTDARMSLNSQVTLFGESRFNIERNVIQANGGTPQINTRGGGWVLNDDSRLWVNENWLNRNDSAFPNRPFFQFDYRFMLLNRARAYVVNNTCTARNTSRPYLVVGSTTNTYVYVADDARLKVCYNNYFGNEIDNQDKLNATVTYNWFTLADPVDLCLDADLQGTATATETSTRDPSGAPIQMAGAALALFFLTYVISLF